MNCLWYYDLPLVGRCGVAERDGGISHIFLSGNPKAPDVPHAESDLTRLAAQQLREYFSGRRREFDLPLSPAGTPFQRRVWELLRDIPYGSATTYKALAQALGQPGAARAVGQAVGANPLPFCIPCHRVIGSDGSITGYALGIELKQRLLELERNNAGAPAG